MTKLSQVTQPAKLNLDRNERVSRIIYNHQGEQEQAISNK